MSVSTLASFEYLEKLQGTTFRKLYQQPSTSLAIFRRMLPHLAKTIVMALLYMSKPLPISDLELWVQPGSKKQRDEALAVLSRLHIAQIAAPSRDTPLTVTLTKNFGSSLRLALTGGGDHQSFGVPAHESTTNEVGLDFLDKYATAQWEGILHYVVNSATAGGGHGTQGPTAGVKSLLQAGNLVTKGRHTGGGITQAGFSFLLQEVNAQVWTLLLLWIDNASSMQLDSVDVLSFLFMLGSLELGRAYSITTLTESQGQMIPSLEDFGLVYIPSNRTQYYPTRLATTLTSDGNALRSVSAGFDAALTAATGSKGFIIIETNYRIYAYTNSPLQIAVLALFTKLGSRYPNMVAGRITRTSVNLAISHGITSEQIISYLSTHAHPQLIKASAAQGGGPVLPPTVVDQIRLWQIENERMKATPGFLFKEFDTKKDYEACVKYADENGVLVWQSDEKRMFFVTKTEALRDFIKSRIKNKA